MALCANLGLKQCAFLLVCSPLKTEEGEERYWGGSCYISFNFLKKRQNLTYILTGELRDIIKYAATYIAS